VKTIHQIGDFGWFSERKTKGKYGSVLQALRSHIKYIESKAVASFNSAENIFAKAKEELKKRWDSRIALKFFIAVPKNWQPEEALANVVAFVSKELNLPFDHIAAYYHASDSNPHVHLLIYPRDRQGKKLRIGRRELKEFHRAWDELLQDLGYELKKYRDGIKLERLRLTDKNAFELPNLPVFLIEKDAELRAAYEEYIKLRNEVAEELEELDDELRHEVEKTEPTDLSIREKIGEFFRNLVNKGFKEKQLEQIKKVLAGSEVLKGLKSKRTLEEKEERNSTFPQPYREPIRPIRKKREKEREEEELELLRKEIEKHEEEEREINTHLMLEEQFIDEELEELLRKYKDENKTKRRERGRDWDFGPSL